ncbi:hypothetical protein Ciccas_009811 [Cichlidogyrus casuarinus]|uniref:FERM domain-containing protein n=1 Tax=Cichlidogyrus casuarinus TaxID=1844966 RepID=A0ABD2PX00_9PLAT
MALRFFRLLSKRFSKNKLPVIIDNKRRHKSDIECRIVHLDDEEYIFYVPKDAKASQVYDSYYSYIGLNQDQDYFGLKNAEDNWIDPVHKLRKQIEGNGKFAVKIFLRVKFFSSDPQNIQDELARYLFTLQLRQDMALGRLVCQDTRVAAELAALHLQAWCGDFDPTQHTLAFVERHMFVPTKQQTREFNALVLGEYRRLASRNMVPANADKLYLDKVKLLQDYGIDWHPVRGKPRENGDCDYRLGLTPSGILVVELPENERIGMFLWANVDNLILKRDKLKIIANEIDEQKNVVSQLNFVFQTDNAKKCKQLWQSCCEFHAFFQRSKTPQKQTPKQTFFRLRSRFFATFRTEYQMYQHQNTSFGSSSFRRTHSLQRGLSASSVNKINSASSVRRVPSRRFSARTAPNGLPDNRSSYTSKPPPSPTSFKQTHVLTANRESVAGSPIRLENTLRNERGEYSFGPSYENPQQASRNPHKPQRRSVPPPTELELTYRNPNNRINQYR